MIKNKVRRNRVSPKMSFSIGSGLSPLLLLPLILVADLALGCSSEDLLANLVSPRVEPSLALNCWTVLDGHYPYGWFKKKPELSARRVNFCLIRESGGRSFSSLGKSSNVSNVSAGLPNVVWQLVGTRENIGFREFFEEPTGSSILSPSESLSVDDPNTTSRFEIHFDSERQRLNLAELQGGNLVYSALIQCRPVE